MFGKDVTDVKVLKDHWIKLQFEDHQEGVINLDEIIKNYQGIFAPLLEQNYFEKVVVSKDLGTICWPNGADIDPDVLYSYIVNKPISV